MEQLDDIMRTFVNETNKCEIRFGKIRDEEKMFAVKKLMCESLLSFRSREATLKCAELPVASENIITTRRRQSQQPDRRKSTRVRRSERTPRMTAEVREEEETSESWRSQVVHKGTGKGNWGA